MGDIVSRKISATLAKMMKLFFLFFALITYAICDKPGAAEGQHQSRVHSSQKRANRQNGQRANMPPICPDFCGEPAKTGMCMAYIPSFFFDVVSEKCQKFIYGGCGGNRNRFRTKDECESTCGCSRRSMRNRDSAINPCVALAEPGPCKAAIPRFFYNEESFSASPSRTAAAEATAIISRPRLNAKKHA